MEDRSTRLKPLPRPLPDPPGGPGGAVLPRSFYRRPALRVARELLGAYLVRRRGRTVLAGRIVEVEAYLGDSDPASHAYRGRSPRNEVMFREGGDLYVYFTYGMHHCANVVTGRAGRGSAVLIRALEPVAGMAAMAANRGLSPRRGPASRRRPASAERREGPHRIGTIPFRALTGGPARLCQAMGITKRENGLSLQGPDLFIVGGPAPAAREIAASTRIGISAGREKRWRFYLRGSPCLSRP